jgi:uncharacterized protein (UPF0332 family)
MKPEQLELIQKSRESICAARLLLDNGFPGYAAARAYYAIVILHSIDYHNKNGWFVVET